VKALHVEIQGLTASFRHPLILSGTQITIPVPSFSNLLGMISACAGRAVRPTETRIGFEFRCDSRGVEIERKDRFQLKDGQLQPWAKSGAPIDLRRRSDGRIDTVAQGIGFREFYWSPTLDLYLTNLNLREAFEYPAATPCFGRSQDIAWVASVMEVELEERPRGTVGPTLMPLPCVGIAGLPIRLAEYFSNDRLGQPRTPGPIGLYSAMLSIPRLRFEVERKDLFHPSDAQSESDVIYLHEWLQE
jgi:CRISPR-associated protein Cas5t